MKNFSDYAKIAINRHGLRGNNALAKMLCITSAGMSHLNTGKTLPTESTMIKLAELAGLPKEEALIDLNLWRSAKNPELKTVWTRIAKMMKYAFLAVFACPEKVNAADFRLPATHDTFCVISTTLAVFACCFLLLHIIHYATICPVVIFALLAAIFALFIIKLLNGGNYGRTGKNIC